ncbi:MAG TPA: J domain-containing protein [Burkholderiales bacterium]|jgi:hypothetical protein
MSPVKSHYDNLKVMRNAPPEVIRAAYKTLAQKYHPDRHSDKEEAERILKIINVAYDVLSDPEQRAAHDAWIDEQESFKEQTRQANTQQTYREPPPRPEPPPRQSYSPPPPPQPQASGGRQAPTWLVAICVVGLLILLSHALNRESQSTPSAPRDYNLATAPAPAPMPQQVVVSSGPPRTIPDIQVSPPSRPDLPAWVPAVALRYPNWLEIVQSKEFGDWYKAMPVGMQELGRSDNADDIIALLDYYTDNQKKVAEQRQRDEIAAKLSQQHPDWKKVVASDEFKAWVKSKPQEEQKRIYESSDPDYIGSVIAGFKGFKTLAQLPTPIREPQQAASDGTDTSDPARLDRN